MTELVFIATDAHAQKFDQAPDAPRRLPRLETLLARASVTDTGADWRAWFAGCAASPALAELSLAAVAGAAFGALPRPQVEGSAHWLATPVHLFAGLDSIHVHPSGLLQLDASEQGQLVQDFARVFADSGWHLCVLGRRELLLSGPRTDADGADPAAFLGSDPSAGLPRGPGAGSLRRLGSEIEMWLYEQPINRARESRGELPITALWLWGGKPPQLPSGAQPLQHPRVFGRDVYVEALCRLQLLETNALSGTLEGIRNVPKEAAFDTVALMDDLTQLEHAYLPEALRALGERRVSSVCLFAATRCFRLTSLNQMRVWRAVRPWWEMLT